MGHGWYYLDERNEVCGPVEIGSPAWKAVSYDPRDHGVLPHSIDAHRPCTWARVNYTELAESCYVSTVFLGLDHSFYDVPREGPPIVFESMAFWGIHEMTAPDPSLKDDSSTSGLYDALLALYEHTKDRIINEEWDCERYATWKQAEEGHVRMVAKLQVALEEARASLWQETLAHLKK